MVEDQYPKSEHIQQESSDPMAAPGRSDDALDGQRATMEEPQIGQQRLVEDLEQERARSAEYLEQAQRARAEMINFRRRMEQEMDQVRRLAGERVIARLLPVVDDFNRAISAVPAEERYNAWIQGLLLIERKLWAVLESEGVRP